MFVIFQERGKHETLLETETETDSKLIDEDKFYLEMMNFNQLSRKYIFPYFF